MTFEEFVAGLKARAVAHRATKRRKLSGLLPKTEESEQIIAEVDV